MAEVTGLRHNAMPYPIYGAPWGIVVPLLDADGDLVTGATTPDSEVSLNGNTFADCTNEMTEIATNSGVYYLLLTAAEMTADVVTVILKSATAGMKTTVAVLYPRKLVSIRAGTSASAGSATSTIVLDASASAVDDFYNGMVCVAVIDTLTEVRMISDYTGSTQTATVVPDWNVAPDNNDTFTIYRPDGVQMQQANVSHWNSLATVALPLVPATAGRSLVVDAAGLADANMVKAGPTGSGTAQTARDIGASVLLSAGAGTGQLDFTSGVVKANATQWLGGTIPAVNVTGVPLVDAKYLLGTIFATPATAGVIDVNLKNIANAAVSASTAQLGVNVVNAAGTAWGSGAITAAAIAADAITAAKIADAAIDRATFAADTGLQAVRSNTAQAGAASTVTLDASASAVDDLYKGDAIYLTGGTGVGQFRICTGYVGATKVATVTPAWATNPDNTSTFAVLPSGMVDLKAILGVAVSTSTAQLGVNVVDNAGSAITAASGIQEVKVASIAANAITATAIAADAITAAKVADGTIDAATFAAGAINAAAIASDAITDAKVASDVTIASVTGAVGSVTGAVGSVATGGIAAASFAAGAIDAAAIADNAIDAGAIAASAITAAKIATGAITNAKFAAGAIDAAAIADGAIDAATFAAGAIDAAAIAADAIGASELAADAASEIGTAVWATATRVLTANTNLNDLSATAVRTAVGLASANLDTQLDALPTNAELATALGTADDAVLAQVALVKAKTDSLTFTVAGKVDANPTAINGDATAAANLAKTTRAIARGTVTSGASTTSIPTSAFAPAGGAADQFKGRIITFDADTTTAALRGQSTDITASSNDAAPTFTVTALTSTPASGDSFSVT